MADAYALPVCTHHTEYIDAPLVAAIPSEAEFDLLEMGTSESANLLLQGIRMTLIS